MASTSPTYLSGFAPALDCRPLYFVEPLPVVRYCCICNAVPERTYLLECLHSFCKPCYDQVLAKGQTCPIDGKDFDVEVVRDVVFTRSRLAEAKVRCQNWSNGCTFVGNVMDMVEHVNSCCFHVVICRRCGESVRKGDMLEHYMTGDCKAKETFDKSLPTWALCAGEQQVKPAVIPGLSESTTNILSLLAPSAELGRVEDVTKTIVDASTMKNEMMPINETEGKRGPEDIKSSADPELQRYRTKRSDSQRASSRTVFDGEFREDLEDGILRADDDERRLSDAGKTSRPEDLVSLADEEQLEFRASNSHHHEACAEAVFHGNLHETCEDLLSHFPKTAEKSSVQVEIYVGPSRCPHRESPLFLVGNRTAYLAAFLPGGNGALRFYLAIRRRTSKGAAPTQCCHKLVIKCLKHRSRRSASQQKTEANRCTCIVSFFAEDDDLKRTFGNGGSYVKPLFDIISYADVRFSVGDLERKNCVQGGHISVAVEGSS